MSFFKFTLYAFKLHLKINKIKNPPARSLLGWSCEVWRTTKELFFFGLMGVASKCRMFDLPERWCKNLKFDM